MPAAAPKWNSKSRVNDDQDCPVCGFGQELPGYDCLACETVASMYRADLARFDPEDFAKAVARAANAALAQAESLAA